MQKLRAIMSKIVAGAVWLWTIPPVRSLVLTNIIRLGIPGAAIIAAILDAYSVNPF